MTLIILKDPDKELHEFPHPIFVEESITIELNNEIKSKCRNHNSSNYSIY